MADKPFQIATEIKRYLMGELNAEEEATLLKKIAEDEQLRGILKMYEQDTEAVRRLQYMQGHKLDDAWERVQKKRKKKRIKTLLPKLSWIALAAASIVLVFFVMIRFDKSLSSGITLNNHKPYKNEVPPGKDRALLTLSSGEMVPLSNTKILLEEVDGTRLDGVDGVINYESDVIDSRNKTLYNTIDVPNAGTYQVILPDGSRVWLNAHSSLHFPTRFDGASREVTLTGEAYFDVVTNPRTPFQVKVNGSSITVLGTSFNVNAYNREVETTLVAGKVKVASHNKERAVKPGEKAVVGREGILVQAANLDKELAWKRGYLYFEEDEISSVLDVIARWYDVEVSFVGVPSQVSFTGEISRKAKLTEVLDIITDVSDLQFTIDGREVTAKPKR